MKRAAFIREIEEAGCTFKAHGKNHDLYCGPGSKKPVSVPRHNELADLLCKKIRKQLGI